MLHNVEIFEKWEYNFFLLSIVELHVEPIISNNGTMIQNMYFIAIC